MKSLTPALLVILLSSAVAAACGHPAPAPESPTVPGAASSGAVPETSKTAPESLPPAPASSASGTTPSSTPSGSSAAAGPSAAPERGSVPAGSGAPPKEAAKPGGERGGADAAHHAAAEEPPKVAYAGPDPCETKNFHFGATRSACEHGGRKAIKDVMRAAVKKAKAAGGDVLCTSCHEDTSTFHLKANAVGDLKKWL